MHDRLPALALAALAFVQMAGAGTLSTVTPDRWVSVETVFDGDTFRTTNGEKIRLLGINAPEIRHDREPGEPLGERARSALEAMIAGRTVRLRLDADRRDDYGRTLAQVYRKNGQWVNAALVRRGLAHVYTFAPNFRWTPALLAAEKRARREHLGIWRTPRFRILEATDIHAAHIGQFRLVRGKVSQPKRWGFSLGALRVSIPRKYRRWFEAVSMPEKNSRVIVRGTIRAGRDGGLYLALHSPFDLEMEATKTR